MEFFSELNYVSSDDWSCCSHLANMRGGYPKDCGMH